MKAFTLEHTHTQLRYHDLPGDEVPILFIHGLGCSSSFDYPQVAAMGGLAHHRRILVDLIGSGYSDKPASFDYSIASHARCLVALIQHLGLQRLVIFGHSMGGAVAIDLAARLPTQVQALILSEANLDSGGGTFSKKIASYSECNFIEYGYNHILSVAVRSGNTQWATGMANSLPIAIYKNACSLVKGQSPSWRQQLYSLTCRRTYIFGSRSLPDPDYDELAAQQIEVATVADAGHSMAWENPSELARMIKQAIA